MLRDSLSLLRMTWHFSVNVSMITLLFRRVLAHRETGEEDVLPSGSVLQGSSPLVSVVIPVYNAMPFLTELLNSLEAQDLKPEEFEVIAVDDGSTDFGGEILDVYAKRNSNFIALHQENSGWPGKPRNVGIENARGEYVFFIDSDDRLGPQALRRMTSFALEQDVDVLVPKMVGLDGRRVQAKLFEKQFSMWTTTLFCGPFRRKR
jgi:cellulose synthase/poly-beta-1,6-N-acetylglucosamine synthase-like glycosyltransferase